MRKDGVANVAAPPFLFTKNKWDFSMTFSLTFQSKICVLKKQICYLEKQI